MKRKVLTLVAVIFCMATYCIASNRMAQNVVTDCGTVHQIPDNASADFAVMMQEYWTKVDCSH